MARLPPIRGWATDAACIPYDARRQMIGLSNNSTSIKFAVISDPHALAGQMYRQETHARMETADDPERNPFAAVRRLIEESSTSETALKADALLCPGDLAHRRNEAGLEYAWRELGAIADLLGTRRIVATAGNHDVKRHKDLPLNAPEDLWVLALRELKPDFPSTDPQESHLYFVDDFVIAEGDDWRVVALNSCANHAAPAQSWHGKIDESTLDHVTMKIARDRKAINIFMCHHHPVEWTHLTSLDTSYMQNGDRLLRALEQDDPARWLLLHGHRHVPALGYAGDTSSGPVRLSAGSLGISLIADGRAAIQNQFYMLDFHLEEAAKLGLDGAGHFRAWDWQLGTGLVAANPTTDLPPTGGFGFRREAHELARSCKQAAIANGLRSVTWDELVNRDPRWTYVAPRDLYLLRLVLERDGAKVDPPEGGSHIQKISFMPKDASHA